MKSRIIQRMILVGMSVLTIGGMAFGAGTAQAGTNTRAAATDAVLARPPWTAIPVHGEPPTYTCTINATAQARLAWIRNPGEPVHLGVLVTTNADIHNPYVFVGCTIRVLVDVVGSDGLILATVAHDAFAGAILDPQGNNKAYTWVDEAPVDPVDVPTIDGIEIRLQNAS